MHGRGKQFLNSINKIDERPDDNIMKCFVLTCVVVDMLINKIENRNTQQNNELFLEQNWATEMDPGRFVYVCVCVCTPRGKCLRKRKFSFRLFTFPNVSVCATKFLPQTKYNSRKF